MSAQSNPVMKEAHRIAKANDQLITKIDTARKTNAQMPTIEYIVISTHSPDSKKLSLNVREHKSSKPASTIINSWRNLIELTVIPDLFNDNLNYKCEKYSDLVRLNKEMFVVAQKFELFGDSARAKAELEKFLTNFQSLHNNGFKQVEKLLAEPHSDLQQISKKVNDINCQIENMANINLNTRFQSAQITCEYCGKADTPLTRYSDGYLCCTNGPHPNSNAYQGQPVTDTYT
ncbi:unnamed protein product [Didymodactylos carnosus]|uniref:Uncharacterized protein n=1 Tax=Didymodactylos carnosus TaxID=1234261 RepID=A0A815CDX6_9BILA|nr:unnamed protein product [Didymodactylos carnosus]CAF1358560.1 unnamed protein product [Didymodactylos carnosus]CAF4079577.1 unnamed protein product [Didymodactylos carnosus]CAF4168962.1 unnamed protein product [Didymodactylos carnosus]